ncbi:MAG: acylase [Acidobacteriaceae bacterium]
MKNRLYILLLLALAFPCVALQKSTGSDVARWQQEAANITIIRDDWGIAHVHGKTDADAVFGMEYAQAEDDFNRVETNYLNSMGRLAESEGESRIYQDLRMKLFIDPAELQKQYAASPVWLKSLMEAFADGLNYYLYKHPEVHPLVIHHFQPWMALSFTEGSIGGDIERVNLKQLQAFYGKDSAAPTVAQAEEEDEEEDNGYPAEPSGSNGIAIAPSNTVDHHALLLINPHTSFFFRSELQMASDQGLDAYGAVTWGQFFIYQGFNPTAGWMHTSSAVDNIDEYLETISKKGNRYFYKYGNEERPVTAKTITIPYKTAAGMEKKTFTAYYTQHGPIVRESEGKWTSIRLMQRHIKALEQSYLRTKAKNYKEFRQTMELHTDSSNNTIFADAEGNIAYFHSNFIPRRDTHFDWTKPVDGSNPATEWHGVLSIDETPHLLNPPNGWLYNSNNWPWSAAGAYSPKQKDYPAYVDSGRESPRGRHAIMVLQNKKNFTIDSLRAAAYDSYLPAFADLIPALLKAYDTAPDGDPVKLKLAEQVKVLRAWDFRWAVDSVPTALAVFYGTQLGHEVGRDFLATEMSEGAASANKPTASQQLQALSAASDKLTADFGSWKTPWGDINRFQRLNDDIEPHFTDSGPSIPVGFTSSVWGSLASFGAHAYPNTKKWYGTSGNSFVAVVEFGQHIRARAVTAGGESGHPSSPHFNDEAQRYATGDLREVYFYPADLKGHTERQYHPGS